MVERCIQPLKAHTHPLYQYADAGYSTHEMVDELDANELTLQVMGLISSIVSVRIVSTLEAFSTAVPPNLVSHLSWISPQFYSLLGPNWVVCVVRPALAVASLQVPFAR
jgi:hypothetical protein